MSDDYFGDASGVDAERKILVIWPTHCVNSIEVELCEAMHIAETNEESRAPMIYADDEGEWNREDYASYGSITVHDAIALRDIVFGEVQLRFRRQLILARDLGPKGTMELYLIACELDGLDPILKG